MSPEAVTQTQPKELFEEDKLFQEQAFNLKTTGSGSTRHIITEELPDGEQKTLCGTTIYLGSPQTLNELAESGCKERKPSFYTGKVCRSCIRVFESRTGRNYTEGLDEVCEQ